MAEPEIPLSHIGAFVPFPTVLFDEQMPRLKDTEWRLLCVIVRQTLGWKSRKGRKKRDWMSQKQLIARTGRNSAALSAALDNLVRKNLVVCQDVGGRVLLTKQQRRQHRGHVYFSLAEQIVASSTPATSKQRKASNRELPDALEKERRLLPRAYTGWTKASVVAQHQVSSSSFGVRSD